jgi:hypothetical protein
MDMSLAQLAKSGAITQEAAFEKCHDAEELQRLIGGGAFGGAGVGGGVGGNGAMSMDGGMTMGGM